MSALTVAGAPSRDDRRDQLVDAYAELVATSGSKSATLEAVASRAGFSKGGLLYHFGGKACLRAGLIDRLATLVDADLDRMRQASTGAVEYYLSTAATVASAPSGSDQRVMSTALIAVLRLAQEGDDDAALACEAADRAWRQVLQDEPGVDPDVARLVQLIGDGVWSASCMGLPVPDLDRIVSTVRRTVLAVGAR